MFFRQVMDQELAQYAYLLGCQRTGEALIIDPGRDIDRYTEIAKEEGLCIVAATETHIHADFLSGLREFAENHQVTIYLSGEGGGDYAYAWPKDSDYDIRELKDNDEFMIGNICIRALHTPGHTPEHISFLVTDTGSGATEPVGIASGDFVFVGDLGRPDLLETASGVSGAQDSSARQLYKSTERFLALEDHLQVWPGHGAGSACGKALGAVPMSTVGYERKFNTALGFKTEETFVRSILGGQPAPPLYFARMKELNREGVPILGTLPAPKLCEIEDVILQNTAGHAVIIDTRPDRKKFMAGHVAGSLYAPLGISFAMIVGSYVDPTAEIYLILDEEQVSLAVRTLVRIGYDNIVGFTPASELSRSRSVNHTLPRVEFSDLDASVCVDEWTILDVRAESEFETAHIPGALNIAHTRLASRINEVPRGKPVMTYCRSGNRASAATALLAREGFEVTLVDGAFQDWAGLRQEV